MPTRLDEFRAYRRKMNERILIECVQAGWTDAELPDALNVALVVSGSLVIPHLRQAVETIDLLRQEAAARA